MNTHTKRYTIEINTVEIDEDGDFQREWGGVSLDLATTDDETLAHIIEDLYDVAERMFKRRIDERTISDRRPETLKGDVLNYAAETIISLVDQATQAVQAQRELPADPVRLRRAGGHGENERRSDRAATALRPYLEENGTYDETALTDLLSDLMHWADRNGVTFTECLERAQMHHEAEATPEDDDEINPDVPLLEQRQAHLICRTCRQTYDVTIADYVKARGLFTCEADGTPLINHDHFRYLVAMGQVSPSDFESIS